MSKTYKIPERMCVVCRQMKPKTELVRIVNTERGVVVDTVGKVNGRGVYICKHGECIAKALKNKNFCKQHGFELDCVKSQLENIFEQQN